MREERKRAKQSYKKHSKGVRYALVATVNADGTENLVFREINHKKAPEELREIPVGRSEYKVTENENSQENGEEVVEESVHADDQLDEAERAFLDGFIGNEQIEDVKEMEVDEKDADKPEVIERTYEVEDQFEKVPIIEERAQADSINEFSSEMDLKNAPEVKLDQAAESFLMRELFGDTNAQENAFLDEINENDAREIQEGLDFFQKDIPDPRARENDQIDALYAGDAIPGLDDLSEGSDLQFGPEDDEDGVG